MRCFFWEEELPSEDTQEERLKANTTKEHINKMKWCQQAIPSGRRSDRPRMPWRSGQDIIGLVCGMSPHSKSAGLEQQDVIPCKPSRGRNQNGTVPTPYPIKNNLPTQLPNNQHLPPFTSLPSSSSCHFLLLLGRLKL